MIFRHKIYDKWFPWFAWHPILIINQRESYWMWLEIVERKYTYDDYDGGYYTSYRSIKGKKNA